MQRTRVQYNNIYFLRHLKTRNNIKSMINGVSILEPIEREEVIETPYPIDIIFCSDALRCKQTIGCYLRTNANVPVYFSELLRERNMGEWEGEPRKLVIEQYPEMFEKDKFLYMLTPPGGESLEHLEGRIKKILEFIANTRGNVLICSHNQLLKMCMFKLVDQPITQNLWNSIDFPHGKIVPISEMDKRLKEKIRL